MALTKNQYHEALEVLRRSHGGVWNGDFVSQRGGYQRPDRGGHVADVRKVAHGQWSAEIMWSDGKPMSWVPTTELKVLGHHQQPAGIPGTGGVAAMTALDRKKAWGWRGLQSEVKNLDYRLETKVHNGKTTFGIVFNDDDVIQAQGNLETLWKWVESQQ